MSADETENKGEGKLAKIANESIVKPPKQASPKRWTEMELLAAIHVPAIFTAEQRKTAITSSLQTLHQIGPRDRLEEMLAIQMQSTHSAAVRCLVRAALQSETPECSLRYLSEATKLQGLFIRQMEALDKHRGKGQQKVVVEHVHVEAGGQAVVGQVHTGGRALQASSASSPKPAATSAPPSRSALPMHLEAGADTVALQTGTRASKAPTLEVMPAAPIPPSPDPASRTHESEAAAVVDPVRTDKPAATTTPRSRPTLRVASEPSAEPVGASAPVGARPSREEPALTAPAAMTTASPTRPGSSSDAGRQPAASTAHPGARPSSVDARPAATPASPTRPRLSSRRVKLDGSVKAA